MLNHWKDKSQRELPSLIPLLISWCEYLQPTVPRVQTTREVRDHGPGSWLFRTEFCFNFAAQNSEHDEKSKPYSKCHNIFILILLHVTVMFLFSHSLVLARQGSLPVSEKLCSIIFIFDSIKSHCFKNQSSNNVSPKRFYLFICICVPHHAVVALIYTTPPLSQLWL